MTPSAGPLTDAELGTYFTDATHPRRAHTRCLRSLTALSPTRPCGSRPGSGPGSSSSRAAEDSADCRHGRLGHGSGQSIHRDFHAALLKQLTDANPMVRETPRFACAVCRSSGHGVDCGMLAPYSMAAPSFRTVCDKAQSAAMSSTRELWSPTSRSFRRKCGNAFGRARHRSHRMDRAGRHASPSRQLILVVDPKLVWESRERDDWSKGRRAGRAGTARGIEGMPPQIQQTRRSRQSEIAEESDW